MRPDDGTLRAFAAFATRTLARSHDPRAVERHCEPLVPGVTEFSAPTATCEFPAATKQCGQLCCREPRTRVHNGTVVRSSDTPHARRRGSARARWRPRRCLTVAAPKSNPGRSRQEHLARCLGPSVQRLRGGHDGVARFLAAALRVCVAPSQKPYCRQTCLRCGHDGGVRWPAGRVQ